MEKAGLGIPVETRVNFPGVAVKTTNNALDLRMRHESAMTRGMTIDHGVIAGREADVTTAETVAIGEGERVRIETTVAGEIAEIGMTVMLVTARVLEIASGALNHLAQVARKIMK